MKILLLTDCLDRGGVETHVETLAVGLMKSGAEVWILSAGGEIAKGLQSAGIPQILMPPPSHSPLDFLQRRRILVRLLKKERFDVLHAHTRLCALLLRTLHTKAARIVTVHAKFLPTPLSRLLSWWGTHTVAVSRDLADHTAAAFGLPPSSIRVIPNGIDLVRFLPPDRKKTKAPPRILFASRLDTDCALGADLLLSLCTHPALLPLRPRVTVAGGGNAYADLKRRAEKLNRALGYEAVRLTGHVTDMPPLLAAHDIFVGVSRAAMEAAAMGCAVILCGNEGYLGLLTQDNADTAIRTNLCCRDCPAPTERALLEALLPLLEDRDALYEAQRTAEALARTRFGADGMQSAHLALYREAVKKRLSLCIGGYFGCGNLGDDLILEGFLSYMQKKHPSVRLTVLSDMQRRLPHVRRIHRRAPVSLLLAFLRADAFLCGGGSLLQNKTGDLSLLYYLTLIRLSSLLGAHPILYAAGIGPLVGERAKARTRQALMKCPYLSLRDPDSMRVLKQIGIPPKKLHLGADAALLLPSLQKRSAVSAPYICIIPRGKEAPTLLAECARRLEMHYRVAVRILLFDRVRDRGAALAAARMLAAPIAVPTCFSDASALLGGASLVLSERLHGMILSLLCATPVIGLCHDARDPKIASFARLCEMPVFVCDNTDPDALFQAAASLFEREADVRPQLLSRLCRLRKKAEKDLEKLLELLYNEKENN